MVLVSKAGTSNMITFEQKGDFKKAFSFLEKAKEVVHLGFLDKYGRAGVAALSNASPENTGLLASSWGYEIERNGDSVSITFTNSDIEGGYPVAILVQYGHGVKGGGYVEGIDYINPAIQPIFKQIAQEAWEEVRKNGY